MQNVVLEETQINVLSTTFLMHRLCAVQRCKNIGTQKKKINTYNSFQLMFFFADTESEIETSFRHTEQEYALRVCLSDLLWIVSAACLNLFVAVFQPVIHFCFCRFFVKIIEILYRSLWHWAINRTMGPEGKDMQHTLLRVSCLLLSDTRLQS